MSADRYQYEVHLTPRGWMKGDRPSDALETWEVEVEQRHAFARCTWTNPKASPTDLESAHSKYGKQPPGDL